MDLEHYHFTNTTISLPKLTNTLFTIISILIAYGSISLLCIILQFNFFLKLIISLTATIFTVIFIIKYRYPIQNTSSHSIDITNTSLTYTINNHTTTLYFEKLVKVSVIKSPKDCIIYVKLKTPNQLMVIEAFPEMQPILSLIRQYSSTTCVYRTNTAGLYTLNTVALSFYIVFLVVFDILLTFIYAAHPLALAPFGLILLGFYFLISYIRQTKMSKYKRIFGIIKSLFLIFSVIGFLVFCQIVLSLTS